MTAEQAPLPIDSDTSYLDPSLFDGSSDAQTNLDQDSTNVQIASENLPSPEKPRLRLTKVIAISGPSFSGKDSVAKILEKRHGWKIYDGTQDGFRRRGNTSGAPIIRDEQENLDFDTKQALMFTNLKTDDEMWIHQTRLGPIILAAEIDERNELLRQQKWETQEGSLPAEAIEQIPAISILLHTSDEERIRRAINHEKYLAGLENRRPRSRRAIIAEMRSKERAETESWKKQYGTVNIGNNPFSRWLERNGGNPVYNRFVTTDGLTPEQVADIIEEYALQLGAAEYIKEISGDDDSGVGINNLHESGITLEVGKAIDPSITHLLPKEDHRGEPIPARPLM